jgi:ketosteroid isomerase-like protein
MLQHFGWLPRLVSLACLLSCTTSERPEPAAAAPTASAARAQVAAAMERYQVAARSVNPDSIAAFYTPTAILFEPGIQPIQTRDSIRTFIASFPGVRVEVATATPDTIEIWGSMALLWGSYFERLLFPGQPLSEQHGKFVAQWARQSDGTWLIQRLFRIPMPSPPSSRAP